MNSRSWKSVVLAALTVFLLLVLMAGIRYFSRPLPKPHVTLTFQGFTTRRTNTYAILCFSNAGPTTVWWDFQLDDTEAETPAGWTTNNNHGFTTVPWPLDPGSNVICYADVPRDAVRWRVHAGFEYYERHHARYEIVDWIIRHHFEKYFMNRVGDGIGWVLRLLPEPRTKYADISTGLLTNRVAIQKNLPVASVK